VEFGHIPPSAIDEYSKNKLHQNMSGGYAIEGVASSFVRSLKGSFTNVIGLPMNLFTTIVL